LLLHELGGDAFHQCQPIGLDIHEDKRPVGEGWCTNHVRHEGWGEPGAAGADHHNLVWPIQVFSPKIREDRYRCSLAPNLRASCWSLSKIACTLRFTLGITSAAVLLPLYRSSISGARL